MPMSPPTDPPTPPAQPPVSPEPPTPPEPPKPPKRRLSVVIAAMIVFHIKVLRLEFYQHCIDWWSRLWRWRFLRLEAEHDEISSIDINHLEPGVRLQIIYWRMKLCLWRLERLRAEDATIRRFLGALRAWVAEESGKVRVLRAWVEKESGK